MDQASLVKMMKTKEKGIYFFKGWHLLPFILQRSTLSNILDDTDPGPHVSLLEESRTQPR